MLDIVVLVSGGGTNLQTLIDRIEDGSITNGRIVKVISSRRDAFALERAKKHGIPTAVVPRGDYADAARYEAALHAEITAAAPGPVSYTHLDVYKRQVYTRLAIAYGGRRDLFKGDSVSAAAGRRSFPRRYRGFGKAEPAGLARRAQQ